MSTIVHCLDGTSYECKAGTVGALKEEYEHKHDGVPADLQTVWACSSGLELDNAATLAGEAEVQLVIDRQTVTVLYEEDEPYKIECRHNSTVGDVVDDVCKTLEATHGLGLVSAGHMCYDGITKIALALDANPYDEKGVIETSMVVPRKRLAHEHLERPLRMVCIHMRPSPYFPQYDVDLGERKLIVQLPWLRTFKGITDSRVMTLQLDDARPDVAEFTTMLTTIEDILSVAEDSKSTFRVQVPEKSIGYWKCNVRNDDTGEDITEDPSKVLTGPHYVRGIIQCTDRSYVEGTRPGGGPWVPWVATWVAKSLEYRRDLPDAAPPCIE